MKTENEPIASMEKEMTYRIQRELDKEKLNKVYELIDELGLTPEQVHSGLEDRMDVFYGDYITYGSVLSDFIYNLKENADINESQMNMLDEISKMANEGHELPRKILDHLIEEEELEIDGRRMLLDSEWYAENFECDPDRVISIITQIWRDQKIDDLLDE